MFNDIFMYVLSLPIILIALSVNEASHGFMANKLGDPTAKNFGRLTLNPIKHIDPFGFLCMLFFHFGWAKPVPVNSRHFKKPRRDMALTAAAGPVSNILLSIVFAGLLRLDMLLIANFFSADLSNVYDALLGYAVDISLGFKMMSVFTYMLYMGVLLNISLAVFNLIPIPPFDGSRIAYTFLPVNLYFKIMRYERYIMIGILLLLWFTPFLDGLIGIATGGLASLVMTIFGFSGEGEAITSFNTVIFYVTQALIS